jgi:hypothetical protein
MTLQLVDQRPLPNHHIDLSLCLCLSFSLLMNFTSLPLCFVAASLTALFLGSSIMARMFLFSSSSLHFCPYLYLSPIMELFLYISRSCITFQFDCSNVICHVIIPNTPARATACLSLPLSAPLSCPFQNGNCLTQLGLWSHQYLRQPSRLHSTAICSHCGHHCRRCQ